GLRSQEGSAVDELLLKGLNSASAPGLKIDLIRLLDNRGVAKATPVILKQVAAPDKDIRITALSALKSLAGPDELSALIAWAKSEADEEVRVAAENAIAGVCSRTGDASSENALNEFKQTTNPSERCSWIRVLTQVGYSNALPALEAAAGDSDPNVANTALEQLGHWPNPAPIEKLFQAADSGASPELGRTALLAVFNLATTAIDESQVLEVTIVSWLRRVNSHVQSPDDKRRLLGLLGRLKTAESFRLLSPYLDDPSLRTEAASGIIQIAPALANGE